MPPLNTQYQKQVNKTASYTLDVSDDVAKFTTSGAGVIATLPLSAACTIPSNQNRKVVANASTSTDPVTIAVQSGNTLVGATAATAGVSIAAGETAYAVGDGIKTWFITGGSGTSGVSGFSGFSGYSGYSGFSGYSGYSGASGISGFSGRSGYSGYSGVSGYSGKSGYSGFSGYSGYTGISGYSGFSGFSA